MATTYSCLRCRHIHFLFPLTPSDWRMRSPSRQLTSMLQPTDCSPVSGRSTNPGSGTGFEGGRLAPDGTFCASLDDGRRVSSETFRRLACDTSLVPMLHGPSGGDPSRRPPHTNRLRRSPSRPQDPGPCLPIPRMHPPPLRPGSPHPAAGHPAARPPSRISRSSVRPTIGWSMRAASGSPGLHRRNCVFFSDARGRPIPLRPLLLPSEATRSIDSQPGIASRRPPRR